MTESQRKNFYIPAWNRCARVNNWRMYIGRLVAQEPSPDILIPELAQVWNCARLLAEQQHRGITPDDLRHGCHITALKRDKSSNSFTNKEVNLVVALFDRLADTKSTNLKTTMRHADPTIAQRDGLIAAILECVPENYITEICFDQCGTRDWKSVSIENLQWLCITANNRDVALGVSPKVEPQAQRYTEDQLVLI